MKKENIENLIKVIEEKREEIVEMSEKCYRETMDGSYFQGWRTGIIAYLDGSLQYFYWSQGTSNFAIYEGEAVTVIDYGITNELGEIVVNREDLTEEEIENFKKFLLENEYIENLEEWENELTYDRISEFSSDIIKRIEEENLDFLVSEYYSDRADEKIDETLEYLKQELENIENGEYC